MWSSSPATNGPRAACLGGAVELALAVQFVEQRLELVVADLIAARGGRRLARLRRRSRWSRGSRCGGCAGGFRDIAELALAVQFVEQRQAFGAAGEAAELVEGALVRRDFRRQAVVLVTDVVVERPRLLVVHQFRKRVEGHRLADARLRGGVVDQRLGIEFDGNASVYGRGETYMFGSANGLQLSIYNKTLQARATDKLDYWESVWATLNGDPFGDGDPAYNPLETVLRPIG